MSITMSCNRCDASTTSGSASEVVTWSESHAQVCPAKPAKLTASCPCGQSVEVEGDDESSLNSIEAWKAAHAPHAICVVCASNHGRRSVPPHSASILCKSGGRNHCSCAVCF